MPTTTTERMNQISKQLWEDGYYTMGNSVLALTMERDKYKEVLERLRALDGEIIPVYNDTYIRMKYVHDLVDKALE